MDFKIFIPSYKRAKICFTQRYLPEATYVVCESDAKAYEEAGKRCWVVPDSAQGSVPKIRNYILDNVTEKNVLLLDDDLLSLVIWNGSVSRRLPTADAIDHIENGFVLANDLGVKFWGVNCIQDKGSYREYSPFSMKSYIGGPFQAFCDCPLRYDVSIPLKEDYDMTLQVLNRYRRLLRLNFIHYFAKQHVNAGGCATYRTTQLERDNNRMLLEKWGPKIVRFDTGVCRTHRTKGLLYDINPMIKAPIKGI